MKDKKIKNKILIAIPIILLIITIIAIKIKQGKILYIDKVGYNLIVLNRNSTLTNIMKIITNLGDLPGIIAITILLIIFLKNKKLALMPLINTGVMSLTNKIIKHIIKRQRPNLKLIKISGYSFPSGHSTASLIFYGTLIYIIHKLVKNKKKRNIITLILISTIIIIGISRIYLGVHYTSDVVTGYLISIIYLIIYIKLDKKLDK